MNDAVVNLLSVSLPISGLAAYSVHLANRLIEMQCLTQSVYPGSAEEMLIRVVEGGRTLLPAGEQPVRYCWTFEAHHVYVAGRPDGMCLALMVENNATTQLRKIQEILQGFLDLPS